MLLFIISFLLVFTSSYFLISLMKPKTTSIGIMYLLITVFAQIVLTFEALSLFSAINKSGVLGANLLIFAISLYLWNKHNRPSLTIKIGNFKTRIINALKLDKSLMVLFIGYCFFLFVSAFLCLVMQVNNGDALSYHISRCLFWISQGNLNHFITADIRNTCLNINSELLYSWILLFIRKDMFIGFFGFTGYILSAISIFNILGILGYSYRKRLWAIIILTSLPSVLVQLSTTETDIIIGGLTLSCLFLFWYAIKNKEKAPLFMASLSFALALGAKTTAIILIPGLGLFLTALCFYYNKDFKPLLKFTLYTTLNFLVFSSYNYILNYLDFSNFFGPQSFIEINKNHFGIKGAVSNFVKHIYMFVDFTGFKWKIYLNPYIQASQQQVLAFLHVANLPNSYFTVSSPDITSLLVDLFMGSGVLGFLVYIPCVVISLFKFRYTNKKPYFLALFGAVFFLNLAVISFLMNYSAFDTRYVVAFIVLSAPVLIYAYGIKFKPIKYLVIFFALSSLIITATNIKTRPFFKIVELLKNGYSSDDLVELINFRDDPLLLLKRKIEYNYAPKTNVLVLIGDMQKIYYIKLLQLEGYNVDFKLLYDAKNIDFQKYNLLIIQENKQVSYITKDLSIESLDKDTDCDYIKPTKYIKIPCFIECRLNNNFLSKRHFVLNTSIVDHFSDDKSLRYNLYENKSNPPLKRNL